MRGKRISTDIGTEWVATPSAIAIWAIGTGVLGGLSTIILTRRVEEAGWSKFKAGSVIGGVIAASAINIIIASKLKGE